jgi:L-alanine-DL-glutamate epimerase-like enolase superfamily enzyme
LSGAEGPPIFVATYPGSSALDLTSFHLGADFPLMVDANMRWSVDEAIRAARGLSEFAVYWLEEPTIPDDVEGHRRIVRDGGLPIATGENLHTLYEFKQMIASGGVTFPEADVTNCGGVTAFIKIAHMAEAFNCRLLRMVLMTSRSSY